MPTSKEVFKKCQVKLLKTLPMKDDVFEKMLIEENFFSGDQLSTMQAKDTSAKRTSFLLDDIINRDVDMYFPRLLEVMETFDGDDNGPVSKLARELQSKLEPSSQPRKRKLSESDSVDESPKKKGRPEPTSGRATGLQTTNETSSEQQTTDQTASNYGIVEEKYEQDEDGEPLYDEKDLNKMYEDAKKFQPKELKKFENLEMKEKEMVAKVQAMIVVVNDFEDRAIKCHLKPPDGSDVILEVLCTKSDGPDPRKQKFFIGIFGKCPVAVTRVAQGRGRDAAMHADRDVFPNMQVFVALGVAAGFAENKVRLGDVLISERIHDCSIVKSKEGDIIPRGEVLNAHEPVLNFLKDNHDWKFPCTKDEMRHSSAIVGPILSKPELLDDPKKREQYIQAHCKEAKGFEMEGFGLMGYDKIGCIIVKGVCDYAGKKAKKWQPTAALAANDCLLKVLEKNDLSAFLNDQA